MSRSERQKQTQPRETGTTGETTMTTDEPGFTVICNNPAKSASVEACWFSSSEWTESDALAQFAFDYDLESDEVAIEE
jgi:hypothetical protein